VVAFQIISTDYCIIMSKIKMILFTGWKFTQL
jgi:hypothetical protein